MREERERETESGRGVVLYGKLDEKWRGNWRERGFYGFS